jgi:uncharacterized LabA/DUF88 family protein
MFGGPTKSALLIDFDNVLGMTSGDMVASIANWMTWLEDGAFDPRRKRRAFTVKRVYWNPLFERYRGAFEAAGFEAFACRAIAKEKKSSADIVMTLDALDVVNQTKGLKEVVLLTSDTDFVPVVNRLQDRGLEVVAMGNEENPTAAIYREYADHVVLRAAFRDAFTYVRPRRTWLGTIAKAPAAQPAPMRAAPQARPQPAAAPAAKPPQTRPPPPKMQADPLETAADRVVHVAKGALGAHVSRQSVTRALRDIPGFFMSGANAWLGFGSYKKLLLAIAKKRRSELRLYAHGNGGVSVAYLSPEDSRGGAAV